MPRKIRPRYGVDPVQIVPPFSFTDTQIARLFAALASGNGDQQPIIALLERCARDYLWWRNHHQQKPSRAEQNAALAEINQLAGTLAGKLRLLDIEIEWSILSHPLFGGYRDNVIADCADRLEDIAHVANDHQRSGKTKRGPRPQIPVQRTVQRLAHLWEAVTGKKPTHNPKIRTEYKGEPLSPAGHFVTAFFTIVDPKVRPTAISTAMAYAVRSRRLRKAANSDQKVCPS